MSEQVTIVVQDVGSLLPIRLAECAERLRLSPKELNRWAKDGAIPAFKIGRIWYVNPLDLVTWRGPSDEAGERYRIDRENSGQILRPTAAERRQRIRPRKK